MSIKTKVINIDDDTFAQYLDTAPQPEVKKPAKHGVYVNKGRKYMANFDVKLRRRELKTPIPSNIVTALLADGATYGNAKDVYVVTRVDMDTGESTRIMQVDDYDVCSIVVNALNRKSAAGNGFRFWFDISVDKLLTKADFCGDTPPN